MANTHITPDFGERIRALRIELDLSQRDLSTDGVTYAYISRIEAGARTPSLSAVIELAARVRERAQAILDSYNDEDRELVSRVSRLQWIVDNLTALYLLIGDDNVPCPFCGRHEHGGQSNGKHNGSSTHH